MNREIRVMIVDNDLDPLLGKLVLIVIRALGDCDSRLPGIQTGTDGSASRPYDDAELQARVLTAAKRNLYRRLLTERAKSQEKQRAWDWACRRWRHQPGCSGEGVAFVIGRRTGGCHTTDTAAGWEG